MSSITDLKITESHLCSVGKTCWSSPSNIALVKYWGKFADQLPCNPSLSFTLSHARTKMQLEWRGRSFLRDLGSEVEFLFEGDRRPAFEKKIQNLLKKLSESEIPFLKYFDFFITASNTFPHSSGIASSASSMSALALCLASMTETIFGVVVELPVISRWARLGSGSAARSVFPQIALWGEWKTTNKNFSPLSKLSSNDYAIAGIQISSVFKNYQDAILIVDDTEKSVSSRSGHALMENHPHAQARFARAHENCERLMTALSEGDTKTFCSVVEAEALELHGLMMTSHPPYILMKPATLAVIQKVQEFRHTTEIPICFTLDAGANIHLLYPKAFTEPVKNWLEEECLSFCVNRRVIYDEVGAGPFKEEIN